MKMEMDNIILIHCLSDYQEIQFLRGHTTDNTTFYSVRYEVEEVYKYNEFWKMEELDKYIIKGRALHHKCDFYAEVAYNGNVIKLIIGDDAVRDLLKTKS